MCGALRCPSNPLDGRTSTHYGSPRYTFPFGFFGGIGCVCVHHRLYAAAPLERKHRSYSWSSGTPECLLRPCSGSSWGFGKPCISPSRHSRCRVSTSVQATSSSLPVREITAPRRPHLRHTLQRKTSVESGVFLTALTSYCLISFSVCDFCDIVNKSASLSRE